MRIKRKAFGEEDPISTLYFFMLQFSVSAFLRVRQGGDFAQGLPAAPSAVRKAEAAARLKLLLSRQQSRRRCRRLIRGISGADQLPKNKPA